MNILMLDDSPQDKFLLESAIGETGLQNSFQAVHDFNKAKSFIDNMDSNQPVIVYIDINFPDGDGFELLKAVNLKSQHNPKIVPIMLSTSKNRDDIEKSQKLGAVSYIVKPDAFNEWVDLVNSSLSYWNQINSHPEK